MRREVVLGCKLGLRPEENAGQDGMGASRLLCCCNRGATEGSCLQRCFFDHQATSKPTTNEASHREKATPPGHAWDSRAPSVVLWERESTQTRAHGFAVCAGG